MKTTKLGFILLLALSLFSACTKDPYNKIVVGTPITNYYFKGTMDGAPLDWPVFNGINTWIYGTSAGGTNTNGNLMGGITALISSGTAYKPQIGFEFRTYTFLTTDDKPKVFNSFLTTGPMQFAAVDEYVAGSKKIVIHYLDPDGKGYSTIGSQAGSTANILAITQIPASLEHLQGLVIKMTVNCVLYPEDGSGAALRLSDAEANRFIGVYDPIITYPLL